MIQNKIVCDKLRTSSKFAKKMGIQIVSSDKLTIEPRRKNDHHRSILANFIKSNFNRFVSSFNRDTHKIQL